MTGQPPEHRFDTVVVGGGQAGLAMGYFLARQGRNFAILEASSRLGETWRHRWDSLRLFTPAFHSGLPGLSFPARGHSFPTKDQVANYLELYAEPFALPVRFDQRIESLSRHDAKYLLRTRGERFIADHVVVATGKYQQPNMPDFAEQLDPTIVQLHSSGYRNPSELPAGDTLVVGAGSSGAEIAVELAATGRLTYLAGRDAGYVPLELIHNRFSLWFAEHVLTTSTWLGSEDEGRASQPRRPARPSQGSRYRGRGSRARSESRRSHHWPPAACRRPAPERVSHRMVDWLSDSALAGSSCRFSTSVATRSMTAALWIPRRACTSLACPSNTRPLSEHIGGVGRDARYIARHLSTREKRQGAEPSPIHNLQPHARRAS
jgi:putative flavoprotein involved in K+ transport